MIATWLAGKISGLIIFCIACLAPILLVGWIWEAVLLHGIGFTVPVFGWHVTLAHGAIEDRDNAFRARDDALGKLKISESNLATCRGNEGRLQSAINVQNDHVKALADETAAANARAAAALAKAKQSREKAETTATQILNTKPGADLCQSADALILENAR